MSHNTNKFKVASLTALTAASVLALSACSGVPSGYEEKVVNYNSGSFSVVVPEEWQVSPDSEYTPNEDSFWGSSLTGENSVGTPDNPGVMVVYKDLDEEESAEVTEKFSELPEELLGSKYEDLKIDEGYDVDGASQALHITGTSDGVTINMVAAVADDERSLAMVIVGYSGNDLEDKDAATIAESFEFHDAKK